ncbi:MAG: hypothetical protein ACE37I_06660 [Rubinisphaera brasiliensis]|uniref:hypothetical protein n=1 Tax=Rubinisphaera brasiliensis TaxID=119 RepID=UPI003918EE62
MSDRLFIHWNADGIDGCDAQSGRGKGRVHTCFSFPYPVDDEGHPLEPVSGRNAAAAAEMGNWLRERVKQTGVKSSEVSVLLPRNECFVRRLELPPVPANELPDLVRMQAASICSTPVEDLAIDFLPLPADEGATAQAVQLVTIAKSRIAFLRSSLEAAGLELASVGISPPATVELGLQHDTFREAQENGPALLLSATATSIEISAVFRNHVLNAHTTDIAGLSAEEATKHVLADLSRVVVPLQHQYPGRSVSCCLLLQPLPLGGLQAAISTRFPWPVVEADGKELSGSAASQTQGIVSSLPAMGEVLRFSSDRVPAVDFINPRRSVVKKDYRKQKMIAAAVAALFVVLIGYGYFKFEQSRLQGIIDRKDAELAQLDETLKKGQPQMDLAAAIETWQGRAIDWIDRLQHLGETLPARDRVYLTDLRVNPVAGDALFVVQANGKAAERRDIEELYRELSGKAYRVYPQSIVQNEDDDKYPYQFELRFDILRETLVAQQQQETAARTAATGKDDVPAVETDNSGS